MTFKIEPIIMSVSKHPAHQLDRWHKIEDNGSGVTYYWQSFGSLGNGPSTPTNNNRIISQPTTMTASMHHNNNKSNLNGISRNKSRLAPPSSPAPLIWSSSKNAVHNFRDCNNIFPIFANLELFCIRFCSKRVLNSLRRYKCDFENDF